MDIFPYGLNSQYPGSDVEDIFEFFDDVKTSLKMFLMMVKTFLKSFWWWLRHLWKSDEIFEEVFNDYENIFEFFYDGEEIFEEVSNYGEYIFEKNSMMV